MALRDKLEVYKKMWRPGAPAGFFARWCTLPVCIVTIFTCVRTVVKKTICFVMSVCLPAWSNSAPNGRIFTKFDIGIFFETLSIQCTFH